MAGGLLVWRLLLGLMPPDDGSANIALRLARALEALLPAGFVLAGMIAAQMAARFAGGVFDPQAGRESRFLRVNQRVISNTVEQMAVFVPALLGLAAAAPQGAMPGVLALGGSFAFARLVFWGGYLASPLARAPGMAATALVTMSTLVAAAWFWWSP
jgi:uncharacterized membrane protein YecN with MAPEG domain